MPVLVTPRPPPPDADQVIDAFRLGWAIAELRGRHRPAVAHVEDGQPSVGVDNALPLAAERTPAEQRLELFTVVRGLSGPLGLDAPDATGGLTRSAALRKQLDALDGKPTDAGLWEQLTAAFHSWDSAIQDDLVLRPRLSAAYQLGRGLAETYWELDPKIVTEGDPRAWTEVLGARRVGLLKRLAGRLSEYIDPLNVAVIGHTLDGWVHVAGEPSWRAAKDARLELFRQGLIWRDLIRGERRVESLVVEHGGGASLGFVIPVLRAFYVQIVIGLIAIVGLVLGASRLAANAGNTDHDVVIGLLGSFGVTATTLYTRAKAQATSLVDELRAAYLRDRATQAALRRPKPPVGTGAHARHVRRTVARRLGAGRPLTG
jgi:hypothetical protein